MDLKQRALEEYCDNLSVHRGGVDGRPYWNAQAFQFMYNPSFLFAPAPGCKRYLYSATDCNNKIHTFEADIQSALLTPIWKDLPKGFVNLTVQAIDENGKPWATVGSRTFFKSAPFVGKDGYPAKACSYRECALKAYDYIFNQPFIQYWLTHGKPDPFYDLNVYPSKIIAALISAMISYAKFEKTKEDGALALAVKAADYLISITFGENSPLNGLPPTYHLGFRENVPGKKVTDFNNAAATERIDRIMMIYPAVAGISYLALEKATGEKRFFDAAKRIADFYKDHVQPNGSWYLLLSVETGENISPNYCVPYDIMEFMNKMHKRTGEKCWNDLEKGCYDYIEKGCLATYNWEGQFEDSTISSNYSNLSHYPAKAMLSYILQNKSEDDKAMAEAVDLLRFIEDQFITWDGYAPWNHADCSYQGGDISQWYSPAGLEQYYWYVPIDASTANIMEGFLEMYLTKKDPLHLEKACVLADTITRMQNEKTGLIPTHWMSNTCKEDGGYLWLNCMIATANAMFAMAKAVENID